MNKIWNALIILGIITFVSCTSGNKDLTLLKVTELGSARISDSAIVMLLQKEIGQKTKITYDLSEDKVSQLGKGSSVERFKISFQSSCPFVLPKSFYKGKPNSPVLTIAIDDILVGLNDLDNTLVYNIVKTLIEDKAQLVQLDNIYNMLKTDFDTESFTFPLHAGTE